MKTTAELFAEVCAKALSVDLEVNTHRVYYDSIEMALEELEQRGEELDYPREEFIASDSIYRLQVYARTPIGFFLDYAPTFEQLRPVLEGVLEAIDAS